MDTPVNKISLIQREKEIEEHGILEESEEGITKNFKRFI